MTDKQFFVALFCVAGFMSSAPLIEVNIEHVELEVDAFNGNQAANTEQSYTGFLALSIISGPLEGIVNASSSVDYK